MAFNRLVRYSGLWNINSDSSGVFWYHKMAPMAWKKLRMDSRGALLATANCCSKLSSLELSSTWRSSLRLSSSFLPFLNLLLTSSCIPMSIAGNCSSELSSSQLSSTGISSSLLLLLDPLLTSNWVSLSTNDCCLELSPEISFSEFSLLELSSSELSSMELSPSELLALELSPL